MTPKIRQFFAIPAPARAVPPDASCVPSPGSDAARQQECCCPVLDNCHGQGFILRGRVAFVINRDCSLHAPAWEDHQAV